MTGPSTVALGLLGEGIAASLTPAMQEQEGRASGLSVTYRRIDARVHGFGVDDLPEVLRWVRAFGLDGLNVTHPFKQAIVPLLDDLSPDAADLGAVNTVVIRDGRLFGRNTDWSGWGRAFARARPEGMRDPVVLLGAGGAGVAVGYALLDQGAEHVTVVDTDRVRAAAAVERLGRAHGRDRVHVDDDVAHALRGARGLVNATPVGMLGHEGLPLPAELVHDGLWVSDVVYFPIETELVRLARSRGCSVVTGAGMAVFQAVGAFEYFTDRVPDAERMLRYFTELSTVDGPVGAGGR